LSYLIETNVISELRKGKGADLNVADWFSGVSDEEIFLSVLTIGEIRRGIENVTRRDPTSAKALSAWLAKLLAAHADRVLPITTPIAEQWGRFQVPNPLPVIDCLLAATAHVHGLTLVTRNVADVECTGVHVMNPWSDSEESDHTSTNS